jgi:hypothetical protein
MKYKLKEIKPNIIAVIVPDNYERAMLFCRVQEFYESPSPKFRDSKFSIWDYFDWYRAKYGSGCFSYPKDFVGFNFPLIVAKKCYQINKIETPYDETMIKIVDELFENGKRKYVIGVENLLDSTFKHEMAHALYYTDIDYKIKMNEITSSISKVNLDKLKKNLGEIGYCSSVFKDEVQAYMATEINKKVTKGLSGRKRLHQKYKKVLASYK